VADQILDVIDELLVLGEALIRGELLPLRLECLPLGAHWLDPSPRPAMGLDALRGVLERPAILLAHLIDGGERAIDLLLRGLDLRFEVLLARIIALDQDAIIANLGEQVRARPQKGGPILLEPGDIDVLFERLECEEGKDAHRYDEGGDNQDDFLPKAQVSEESRHK
jgi:hypothetical protein